MRKRDLLTGILLGLVPFAFLVLWGARHGYHWSLNVSRVGTLGEWIASIGTVAAVTLALRESRHALEQKRLAELCSLAAWVVTRRVEEGVYARLVRILNKTDFPVFDWYALPASETGHTWHVCASKHHELLPGDNSFSLGSSESVMHTAVRLYFVDREGQSWVRLPTGDLLRDSDDLARRHVAEVCGDGG